LSIINNQALAEGGADMKKTAILGLIFFFLAITGVGTIESFANGLRKRDTLQYVEDVTWCDVVSNMRYGENIAIGDIDGDGFDDLIVTSKSDVQVYYGNASASLQFNYPSTTSTIGELYNVRDVATADLNDDGFKDIIISQRIVGSRTQVLAFYGAGDRLPSSLDSSDADWNVTIDLTTVHHTVVTNAGDVSGDGIDDIMVGFFDDFPYCEKHLIGAYVIYGFDPNSSQDAEPQGPYNVLYSDFLYSFGNAGDVNGDGITDVISTVVASTGAEPEVVVYLGPNQASLCTWGYNLHGQLGDGTTNRRVSPQHIGTDTDWLIIATKVMHTVALKSDGTLWAWGYNNYGQLGDCTTDEKHSPTKIGQDTDWISVAAGVYHTLALKSDGTLWAWGYNLFGQLGDGQLSQTFPTPSLSSSLWLVLDRKGQLS